MRRAPSLVLAAIAALFASPVSAEPAEGPEVPPADVLDAAADWVLSHQDEDGCIAGAAPSTDWSTLALAAAGRDPAAGSPSLVDGLRGCAPERGLGEVYVTSVARHILAIVAAGEDPRAFGGTDWIAELRGFFTGVQFTDPACLACINDDAWAILALRAAGASADDLAVEQAAAIVLQNQNEDGGWGHAVASDSTVDDTAAFIEALTLARAVTPGDEPLDDALDYLATHADPDRDGCFELNDAVPGANVDSTAWAVLALLTAHRDPRAEPWGAHGGPWQCLLDHRHDDGGFGMGASNLLSTPQAMLALAALPHGRLVPGSERPVAQLSASSEPVAGTATTLVAEGVAFAGWQDEEGDVLEGARVEWWPLAVGRARFEVLLVDEDGVASRAGFETDVAARASSGGHGGSEDRLPADLPAVVIHAPGEGERNVTVVVRLVAEAAGEPVVALRLDWGDGSPSDWSPLSELTHRYGALGEFQVRAWAKDAADRVSDEAPATVTIRDARPVLTVSGPSSVLRRAPASFEALASDPDGPAPLVSWHLAGHVLTGPRVDLAFDRPGAHVVRVTATDAAGQRVEKIVEAIAVNRPPVLLDVGPLVARPNSTHSLNAAASDPEGDPLEFLWSGPGLAGEGGQFHLATGAPGRTPLTVNVSDPFGGWALGRFDLVVSASPEAHVVRSIGVTTSASRVADEPPAAIANEPPRARLTQPLRGVPGVATVLRGDAHDADGDVVGIEVSLGATLPVRGTASFLALAPPLPAGSYAVAARALDDDGAWGPWDEASLLVVEDEDLDTGALDADDRHATPQSLVAPTLALALALALARRRG